MKTECTVRAKPEVLCGETCQQPETLSIPTETIKMMWTQNAHFKQHQIFVMAKPARLQKQQLFLHRQSCEDAKRVGSETDARPD